MPLAAADAGPQVTQLLGAPPAFLAPLAGGPAPVGAGGKFLEWQLPAAHHALFHGSSLAMVPTLITCPEASRTGLMLTSSLTRRPSRWNRSVW
jgi:hypothetical protein